MKTVTTLELTHRITVITVANVANDTRMDPVFTHLVSSASSGQTVDRPCPSQALRLVCHSLMETRHMTETSPLDIHRPLS